MTERATIVGTKEQVRKLTFMRQLFEKETNAELLEEMIDLYIRKKGYNPKKFTIERDRGGK